MEFPTTHKVLKAGYRLNMMDGTVTDRADDGTLRLRRLFSQDRYEITFRIGFLSAADVEGVRQFYRSYRAQEITWTDPFTGVTYDVYMTEPPQHIATEGLIATMEVYMEGTAQ